MDPLFEPARTVEQAVAFVGGEDVIGLARLGLNLAGVGPVSLGQADVRGVPFASAAGCDDNAIPDVTAGAALPQASGSVCKTLSSLADVEFHGPLDGIRITRQKWTDAFPQASWASVYRRDCNVLSGFAQLT